MRLYRLLAIVMIAALFVSCTALAEVDWASMDDDSIYAEIENAMAELGNRGLYVEDMSPAAATPEPTEAPAKEEPTKKTGKATLLKTSDVVVTATVFEVSHYEYNIYNPMLYVRFTAENNGTSDFEAHIDNVSINDWEVDHMGYISVGAGHKIKDDFELKMEDAEVSELSDIEKVTFSFYYEGADGKYIHTKPKTISLKSKKK